jgi:hypothetical protein
MRPKGVIDAQQVNIPAPAVEVDPFVTCRKASPRGRFVAEVGGVGTEKSRMVTRQLPVLKLTQVGEESILRRSRELRLRN